MDTIEQAHGYKYVIDSDDRIVGCIGPSGELEYGRWPHLADVDAPGGVSDG